MNWVIAAWAVWLLPVVVFLSFVLVTAVWTLCFVVLPPRRRVNARPMTLRSPRRFGRLAEPVKVAESLTFEQPGMGLPRRADRG